MDFSVAIFVESIPLLAEGAMVTILLTVVSCISGIMIGLVGALGRVSHFKPARYLAATYVLLFRALPLLLTLTILYYGLPSIDIRMSAMAVAILGLSINFGAYSTEIIRAGIESVSPAQVRAARAIGMSRSQAMVLVVLPQAVRRVLAPISNEVLATLKYTSLVSVIAIPDLLRVGVEVMSWRANTFSPLIGVALGYFILAMPLIGLNKFLETHIRVT